MKLLLTIMSCQRDRLYHKLVRDTWLQQSPVPHRFFLGRGSVGPFLEDEILTDAPDGYYELSRKLEAMCKYTLENEYDFMFKCDIDTYVFVPRLLRSGFENYDFYGGYGGSGYWLSRKAMQLAALYGNHRIGFAEDWWIKESLKGRDISMAGDSRYWSQTKEGPAPENDIATVHCYSESQKRPDGEIRDRPLGAQERLALFSAYYEKSQKI